MDASPSTHPPWEYAAALPRNPTRFRWPRWAETCSGLPRVASSGRTPAQHRHPTPTPVHPAVHLAFSLFPLAASCIAFHFPIGSAIAREEEAEGLARCLSSPLAILPQPFQHRVRR